MSLDTATMMIAASAALGICASAGVKNKATVPTSNAVRMVAACVRAPAL